MGLIFCTRWFVSHPNSGNNTAFVSCKQVVLGLDVVSNPVCVHCLAFQLSSGKIAGQNKLLDADNLFQNQGLRRGTGSHKFSNIAILSNQMESWKEIVEVKVLVQTSISDNFSKGHRNFSKKHEMGMDLCLDVLYFKVFSSTKVSLYKGSFR